MAISQQAKNWPVWLKFDQFTNNFYSSFGVISHWLGTHREWSLGTHNSHIPACQHGWAMGCILQVQSQIFIKLLSLLFHMQHAVILQHVIIGSFSWVTAPFVFKPDVSATHPCLSKVDSPNLASSTLSYKGSWRKPPPNSNDGLNNLGF